MYEDSKKEIESRREADDYVLRLLRMKDRPFELDDPIDFKKLKWNVSTTFGTTQKFKDAIAHGFDLKMGVSNSKRKRVGPVYKDGCK